jgi:uncharacterized protein
MNYVAPWWLPEGHTQTIWPALWGRRRPQGWGAQDTPVRWLRERWDTPDDDFIDVDVLRDTCAWAQAPWLVLFHGLEGGSSSHYALAFAHEARQRGWRMVVPHFRGCSGEINRAPRAYHSGDHVEINWVLRRLRERATQPLHVVGVSLGGNALMCWAAENGQAAAAVAASVCSVCSPLDLAAGGEAIGKGLNRHIYTRMFLSTMVPKALRKLQQHPGLFDGERLAAARDLYEFDNVFTAPLHGFADTRDYWARASAKPRLRAIAIPALLINARNDPFVPAHSLPTRAEVSSHCTLWQPATGGHVGFALGALPPGHVMSLPAQVCQWMAAGASPTAGAGLDHGDPAAPSFGCEPGAVHPTQHG